MPNRLLADEIRRLETGDSVTCLCAAVVIHNTASSSGDELSRLLSLDVEVDLFAALARLISSSADPDARDIALRTTIVLLSHPSAPWRARRGGIVRSIEAMLQGDVQANLDDARAAIQTILASTSEIDDPPPEVEAQQIAASTVNATSLGGVREAARDVGSIPPMNQPRDASD